MVFLLFLLPVQRRCAPGRAYACQPTERHAARKCYWFDRAHLECGHGRDARGTTCQFGAVEARVRCFLFCVCPPLPELNSHTSILRMTVPEVKKKMEESRKSWRRRCGVAPAGCQVLRHGRDHHARHAASGGSMRPGRRGAGKACARPQNYQNFRGKSHTAIVDPLDGHLPSILSRNATK